MREEEEITWVVYQMTIRKKLAPMNVICEQSEWDAMELAKPGGLVLIKQGISNEAEAERLARSQPSGAPPAMPKPKTRQ